MPVVLRIGPCRLFFYAADVVEPVHVHVQREDNVAKFWAAPVRLADAGGFRASELRRIERIVTDHQTQIVEAWNAFKAQA